MGPLQSIPADLVTPLGAYLRLRRENGGSFLLESVERGRLGRNSFIGWGSEVVSFEEAERLDAPVVGYLAYDFATKLEPTVSLPAEGAALPESRFVVVESLVRFDHAAGVADVLVGDADEIAARLEQPFEPTRRHRQARRGSWSASRHRPATRRWCVSARRTSRRATRIRSSPPSGRHGRHPRRRSISIARFAGSIPRRTSSSSSSTGSRSWDPRPNDSSHVRAVSRHVNPIAGTTSASEGDVERLLASEKDRAEHVMLVDLGRNDLSRVCRAGTVRVVRSMEVERFSHVSHLVSEVAGELRDGVTPFDLPPGLLPRRHRYRRSEDPRDADHLGARALPARPICGRGRVRAPGRNDGHVHRAADDGRRRRRRQRPGGSRRAADSDPAAEHRECLAKLAALEAAIALAEEEYA